MRRLSRLRVSSKNRRAILMVDRLEVREVLSTASAAAFVARPMFDVGPLVANSTPPASAYTPTQIQQAYGFNQISFGSVRGDGTGQTIAIVDAYDDPNIQADLNAFSAQFGLPSTTITRVDENGGASLPSTDSTGGWELEEALDVEWAHAIAPGAKILLVEAASASDADLLPAVNYAASHANVVSLSWGGGEFSSETAYDGYFSHAGVAFVASSGDYGAPISWPAASPNVLAVGGTSLNLGSGNVYGSEAGWSGSGGGPSAYETQPAYQTGVVTQTSRRANPDVAYNASPNTGFAVYDSFNYN
ncbi:MAG TPA: S53 family peptidase, partial [Isosphaeraceae bacterium]|nr:S53 family peptidase [Isosphaeraceae bacterium]